MFLYPNAEWEEFVIQLKQLPGNRQARQLQRYFLAGAVNCEVDKQGRILIPAKLREHAKLEKEVVFVGVLGKIEIWSKEQWDSNNDFGDVESIAENMSELGISF